MVNHNTRTLEMLALPLASLDQKWQAGAGLLRICLEHTLTKQDMRIRKRHVPIIADIVSFSDQTSAAIYKENLVISELEDWQQYKNHLNKIYWICLPERIDEIIEN